MPVVVLGVLLGLIGLMVRRPGRNGSDLPSHIVAAATNRLPAGRQEWGQAMLAELTHIPDRGRRWRFTIGVLRVTMFPPVRHRGRVLVAASVALALAVTATLSAAHAVPSLAVFVAVLGLLLCGYTTVVAARAPRPPRTVAYLLVCVVALGGLAATVTTVVQIAGAHPSATTDHTHVFSVLLALIISGYLAAALTPRRTMRHARAVLWWALAATATAGTVWIVIALTTSTTAGGVTGLISPVGIAATLAASIGAAATGRDTAAGTRAGVLTAILTAPIHFAVTMTTFVHMRHWTLTDPYDIAAYPHSGYPDIASYLLGDILGGNIIAGLIFYPVIALVVARIGAAIGTGRPGSSTRRIAPVAR
jgi:hypothetical protein